MKKNIFLARLVLTPLLLFLLGGCAVMPHAGPSKRAVQNIGEETERKAREAFVVKVDDELARRLKESHKIEPFSKVFGKSTPAGYTIGPGDELVISIWETPPALLFKSPGPSGALIAMGTGAEELPPQMVMEDGTITVPFVGRLKVAGKSLSKIEQEIASRLAGQANSPQVLVRVSKNLASRIAVIGDVKQSCNIPLTPRGERLLDALASAGGVTHPITKVSLQLSRSGKNARMPLDKIIDDPAQNLQLKPGDVVAALFQPWTFSVLGATGRNQEVPFEASGISLAQALARSGGLNDNKADPGGVFIFRYEDPSMIREPKSIAGLDGLVPVVYQIDFSEPSTFFVTQNFPMQDKDVVYVANMPAAELQKFLQMVGMVLSPTLSIGRYQLDAVD